MLKLVPPFFFQLLKPGLLLCSDQPKPGSAPRYYLTGHADQAVSLHDYCTRLNVSVNVF